MTTPTTLKRPKRNASVTIHLSPEEKRIIAKQAFEQDLGTSQFVRRVLLKSLKAEKSNA